MALNNPQELTCHKTPIIPKINLSEYNSSTNLVSFYNGVSTFAGYLIRKPSKTVMVLSNPYLGDKLAHTFSKDINPNANVMYNWSLNSLIIMSRSSTLPTIPWVLRDVWITYTFVSSIDEVIRLFFKIMNMKDEVIRLFFKLGYHFVSGHCSATCCQDDNAQPHVARMTALSQNDTVEIHWHGIQEFNTSIIFSRSLTHLLKYLDTFKQCPETKYLEVLSSMTQAWKINVLLHLSCSWS